MTEVPSSMEELNGLTKTQLYKVFKRYLKNAMTKPQMIDYLIDVTFFHESVTLVS